MKIVLKALPETIRGIYDVKGLGADRIPARMRYLHPAAADALLRLEAATGGCIYSDIYRSAEAQLVALQTKAGTQRPAWSAHGYGFAVDVDIDGTMRLHHWSYPQLLDTFGAHGWYCHRRDRNVGSESWHFNYFGDMATSYLSKTDVVKHATWAAAVETKIQDAYGKDFALDATAQQTALKKLGMYKGEIDGALGPLSKAAVSAFQRAWFINEMPGTAGPNTQRILSFVAADHEYV